MLTHLWTETIRCPENALKQRDTGKASAWKGTDHRWPPRKAEGILTEQCLHIYAGIIREQSPMLPRCYSTTSLISSTLDLTFMQNSWTHLLPTSYNPVSFPHGFIFIYPAWFTHFFSKYLWSFLFVSGWGIGTQWWIRHSFVLKNSAQRLVGDRRPTMLIQLGRLCNGNW